MSLVYLFWFIVCLFAPSECDMASYVVSYTTAAASSNSITLILSNRDDVDVCHKVTDRIVSFLFL